MRGARPESACACNNEGTTELPAAKRAEFLINERREEEGGIMSGRSLSWVIFCHVQSQRLCGRGCIAQAPAECFPPSSGLFDQRQQIRRLLLKLVHRARAR